MLLSNIHLGHTIQKNSTRYTNDKPFHKFYTSYSQHPIQFLAYTFLFKQNANFFLLFTRFFHVRCWHFLLISCLIRYVIERYHQKFIHLFITLKLFVSQPRVHISFPELTLYRSWTLINLSVGLRCRIHVWAWMIGCRLNIGPLFRVLLLLCGREVALVGIVLAFRPPRA